MGAFHRPAKPCAKRSALPHSVQTSKSGMVAADSVPSGTASARCKTSGQVQTSAAPTQTAATTPYHALGDHASNQAVKPARGAVSLKMSLPNVGTLTPIALASEMSTLVGFVAGNCKY